MECVVWWFTVASVPAQESNTPAFIAVLAVSSQSECILHGSGRDRIDRPLPDWPVLVLHRTPTDAEAWEHFEVEYRLAVPSPLFFTRQIETAKYGLDTTVFAVDRFVKSIRDHADFEFDHGNLHRTHINSHGGFLDHPHMKLDLDMWNGRPYIGTRLVIPFGN